MDQAVEYVDLSEASALGLYRLTSSSSTVYYVDATTSPVRMLRAIGAGRTGHGELDNQWVDLTDLISGPRLRDGGRRLAPAEVDADDVRHWMLRVGSRHQFTWDATRGWEETWWIQRVLEGIEPLEAMPARDHWTRGPDEVDFTDGPALAPTDPVADDQHGPAS